MREPWYCNSILYLQYMYNVHTWSFYISKSIPAIRGFVDLKKNKLHEFRVSGTVLKTQLTQNFPTYAYIT